MPTENDENAVLVSDKLKAKTLLIEILRSQREDTDIHLVEQADYVAAIVQNDDEASVYYYVLNRGNVTPQRVGQIINTATLPIVACPNEEGVTILFHPKFTRVENILLGMKPREAIAGTVWLEDVICE
ncbi:MAG: hypothetical protein KF799_09545 [Bdellovibrionales bacterium]|nr:hypothetical protein [Bdellovibrionales bacterium]